MELVENPELIALGDTAATESRSKMAQLADEELIKAQVQADEGNLENFMLLLKLSWHKHGNDTTIPKFYRNEANRTTISKAVLDKLATWQKDGTLPPVPIAYQTSDVIPLGVLLDCGQMPPDQFQLILQQKNFRQTLSLTLTSENAWNTDEKFEEQVTVTIGNYAIEVESKYVFSLTFSSPMVPYSVTDLNGKARKITRPPTEAMVHTAFSEFGTPHYRADTTQRDT